MASSLDTLSLSREIEQSVLARDKVKALSKIKKLAASLKDFENEMTFSICDWYRRLGLAREGYLFLNPKEGFGSWRQNVYLRRRLLWMARFLNMLGAASYALEIASQIDLQSYEDSWALANIFRTNYHSEKALQCFEKMFELDPDPSSYRSRMNSLCFADALSDMGRFDEAIEFARRLESSSSEALLKGICCEALGEFFARQEKVDEALRCLRLSEKYLTRDTFTPDRAYLEKWLGFVLCLKGENKEGLQHLDQAEKILKNPSIRIEVWMELLLVKGRLGLLTEEEKARLYFYPGTGRAFLSKLDWKYSNFSFGPEEAPLKIVLASNEYFFMGKSFLEIPLELKVAAYLALAGPWGINTAKLLSVTWPGEVFSLVQLEHRLSGLVHRLRSKYGLEIDFSEQTLTLQPESLKLVKVEVSDQALAPRFFVKESPFAAASFREHYGLSKSQSALLLRKYTEQGVLGVLGKGPKHRYALKSGLSA